MLKYLQMRFGHHQLKILWKKSSYWKLQNSVRICGRLRRVEDFVKKKFLLEIAEQCENLRKTKNGGKPSILKDKSYEAMKSFSWIKILEEGHKRCPDIIDVICTICAPAHRQHANRTKKGESRIPAIGLAYAGMMHQANQQLSLVQRMNTMILCHGHAEKAVMFQTNMNFLPDVFIISNDPFF